MKIKDRAKPKTPSVEPGVYMAVCVGVVDLGEQYSEKFKNYSNKVKFVWALPSETVEIDGKTEERQLSKEFTFSVSKKGGLRGFLQSWNGRNYSDEEFAELDVFEQLGKACQLQVVLSETGEYSNVENLMPIPKGLPAPASKTAFFTWDMDAWDDAAFEKLPEWTREQIKKSTQYQKEHLPQETVAVQQPQQAVAGFQMPANMPGVNFQAAMQQAAYTQPQSAAAPNNGSVIPF